MTVTKLLCPKCMKTVNLPDDFAGREVPCPSCGTSFPAPTRYNPTVLPYSVASGPAATGTLAIAPTTPVGGPSPSAAQTPAPNLPEPNRMSSEIHADRPAPPPGLVPPVPPLSGPAGTFAGGATIPAGYTRSHGIVISPRTVAWMSPILLTVTLSCTFFSWVGTYVGGTIVDSQGLYRSISGYPERNFPLEPLMQTPSDWLDKVKSDWLLMVPFLLCLLAALVLSWIERTSFLFDVRKVPPLYRIWPWVHVLTLVFAGLAFAFLLSQDIYGFGLERAAKQVVNEKYSKDEDAAANKPSELDKIKYKKDQEYDKFSLEHTFWLYLAITCNLLAVLMLLIRLGLIKRGTKPPPQIVIQY